MKKVSFERELVILLIIVFAVVFVWTGTIVEIYQNWTDYPYGLYREKVPEEDLAFFYSAGYSDLFYEYARQVKIYYLDKEKLGDRIRARDVLASCSFYDNQYFGNRIYIFNKGNTSCFFHEVGHHIDIELGKVSQSAEFRAAVTETIDEFERIKWEGCDQLWCVTAISIVHFPGVNGNKYSKGWGGYKELYATLFEVGRLDFIPPPLRTFFEPFIPP